MEGYIGQFACLNGYWYQIRGKRTLKNGNIEYYLYGKFKWIPVNRISEFKFK